MAAKEIAFQKTRWYEQPELGLYFIQKKQNYGGVIQPRIVYWGYHQSQGRVRI